MTQEEKQLLLRDLSARLPYDVCCRTPYATRATLESICNNGHNIIDCTFVGDDNEHFIESIKPYLRPMSSMTEEEKKEYGKVCELDTEILANHPMNGEPFPALYNSQDWLNRKRFAYRTIDGKDMFELGLAIEVTEENNPYKE